MRSCNVRGPGGPAVPDDRLARAVFECILVSYGQRIARDPQPRVIDPRKLADTIKPEHPDHVTASQAARVLSRFCDQESAFCPDPRCYALGIDRCLELAELYATGPVCGRLRDRGVLTFAVNGSLRERRAMIRLVRAAVLVEQMFEAARAIPDHTLLVRPWLRYGASRRALKTVINETGFVRGYLPDDHPSAKGMRVAGYVHLWLPENPPPAEDILGVLE